jgi:hypothetical protein
MSSLRVYSVALLSTLLAIAPLYAVDSYHVTDFVNPVMDDASETVLVSNNSGSCTDGVGCTATCDQCAVCDTCCCNECVPPWRVQVGYINMSRSTPSRQVLGSFFSDFFSLDLGNQSGIDVSLRKRLNQDWDVDARYLWISDFETSQTVDIPPAQIFNFTGVQAGMQYRSSFQSAEANLRRNYGCWGLSGGFRFAELNDTFGFALLRAPNDQLPDGAVVEFGSTTRNKLYGFQLGADAILWQNCCNGFRIDGFAKAGIYGNDASATTGFGVVSANNVQVQTLSAAAGNTAFLGELGVMGVYPLTEHMNLRAGYQMLWVSGVALADDAFIASADPNAPFINTSSDVFYHGANVGLEIAW